MRYPILAVIALSLGAFARPAEAGEHQPEMVIVPYDATKPIAGQKPDQFYLPYEHFLELWQAAKQHRAGPKPEPASTPYVLTSARYEGVAGEHLVAFTGKLDVTTCNDPWVKVPLAFKDVKIGSLTVDGATAVFDNEHVLVEKPGRHIIEAAFEIPLGRGAKNLEWGIPHTSATLLVLTLPDERTRAVITPGSGVIERVEGGRTIVTAALGATDRIHVEFQPSAAVSRVTAPAEASILTALAVRPGVEEAAVRYTFSFPGARQDRFTVFLENGLTLFNVEAANLKSWKLAPGAGRQALEITLNEPAQETFAFSLQVQRTLPALPAERIAPVFSAAAKRLDYAGTAIFADERLEVTPAPGASLRQIPWDASACAGSRLVSAYAGVGKLAYSAKQTEPKREARIDYVYQVNRRKIELMASLQLFAKGGDLSTLALSVPAQFEVQAVESARLQDWWRVENTLHLRFKGETPEMTPLVVYLVRRYAAAPTALEVQPLTLEGFKRVSGEAVIAAHKGVEAAMKLSTEGVEIAPEKAATDFQVLPPLERKRGFTFKTQNFSAQVALTALPARTNALWVMHAQAHEGWIALSMHARLTVRQGSIERASFSLPKSIPEARVTGGEVRETRSHIEGERRIYEVQFQNDVYESAEFTADVELPASGKAELPSVSFPEAQMMSGFVLTENVSEYEMRVQSSGVDQAQPSEIPFLPQLSKGAGIFRVGTEWNVTLSLDRLEKAASRSAFVAWAEMTSALRADGTEWHRASYRLQNRSLQFLPVRLPAGAELMSVRVAGQSVRADHGLVNGRDTLLVPLIKTKPGDLSYDVELVYRIAGAAPGWRVTREFRDPELPGITVERTLWNVWLPENRKLQSSGGNMEPVLGDLNKTEKLEGKLQELKTLNFIANSSRISNEERSNALMNAGSLWKELATENRDEYFAETNGYSRRGSAPKPTPVEEVVGKKGAAQQGDYVANKRRTLNEELGREAKKLEDLEKSTPNQAVQMNPGAQAAPIQQQWAANGSYAGKASAAATPPPAQNQQPGFSGNLFLNDNIVLQQSVTIPRKKSSDAFAKAKQEGSKDGAEADRDKAKKPSAASSFPFVDSSGNIVGANQITSGNRSGSTAISANAIDALLFNSPTKVSPQPAAGPADVSGARTDDRKDQVLQTARGNNLRSQQQQEASELARNPQGALPAQGTGAVSQLAPNAPKPAAAAPAMPQQLGQSEARANQTAVNAGGTLTFGGGTNTFSSGGTTTTMSGGTTISGTVNGPVTTGSLAGERTPASSATMPVPQATPAAPLFAKPSNFGPADAASVPALQMAQGAQTAPTGGTTQLEAGRPEPPQLRAAAASAQARSDAQRLQAAGRISLAVDFPTEGNLFHFKKVKSAARLEITVLKPSALTRWWNLAITLAVAGILYGMSRFFNQRRRPSARVILHGTSRRRD